MLILFAFCHVCVLSLSIIISVKIIRKQILAGIVSKRISMVDGSGFERMVICQDVDNGISIHLLNQKGESLARFYCEEGESGIIISNGNGYEGISLMALQDYLFAGIFDSFGEMRTVMSYSSEEDFSGFEAFDGGEDPIASMNCYRSNPLKLILSDKEKVYRTKGQGFFFVQDKMGMGRYY